MSLTAVLAAISSASADDIAVAPCLREIWPNGNYVVGPVMTTIALEVDLKDGRNPARSASVNAVSDHSFGLSPMKPSNTKSKVL